MKIDRKKAIQDYKLRKSIRGIFAVRCAASGKIWIEASLDLDKAQNREWFVLRNKSHRNGMLQSEWNRLGERAFEYEILEKLKDDISPVRLSDVLKDRKRYWIVQLNAEAVHP